jgi:hypothetical protein
MNLKRGLACMLTFLIVASALMISDGNLVAAPLMTVCFTCNGTVFAPGGYPNPPWGVGPVGVGPTWELSTADVNIDIDGATYKYTSTGPGTITTTIKGNILTSELVLDGYVLGVGSFYATVLYEQDQSSHDHTPLTFELVADWSYLLGTTKAHLESKLTAIGMYKYTPPNSGTWLLESVHSDAHLSNQALGIDVNAQLQKVTGVFTETDTSSDTFDFWMPEFCYSPAAPVGGTMMFVDKFAVASPYLVLLALMAAVVIVVLARRKPRN